MRLTERYQQAVDELFAKVRATQTENIIKAAEIMADAVAGGHKIWLGEICHGIQDDLLVRGGGPILYREYHRNEDFDKLEAGDVVIVSSVSGRTKHVVDMAWDAIEKGVKIIAFTSMEYATQVDPIHPSGKKLYEFATHTVDNCAPAAEAMIDVEGIEAKFGAASGIASDYIMWCITATMVEKLMEKGITPGIYKSANFPGGPEYNNDYLTPRFEKLGY
ncbi:MAG: DUF2529 family protein [Ruminococcaceae bacterium]|nr:DUF2529 family protein [Oscillospiraceae bacterium]